MFCVHILGAYIHLCTRSEVSIIKPVDCTQSTMTMMTTHDGLFLMTLMPNEPNKIQQITAATVKMCRKQRY